MSSSRYNIKNVSDTAFWVATYRAIESKRKDALFNDPYAALLTGERGKQAAGSMQRFAKYAYWSVTIRTALIDEYILKYIEQGYRTVINLGAGLDTRPYRLALPPQTQWIEIDFADVIALKNEKLKEVTPRCKLERTGLDLSDQEARQELFKELNQRCGPAIILTEGVTPYLSEDAVSSLASDIYRQPDFKLWINEYYSPDLYSSYQSEAFINLLGDSPFRFFPTDWFAFFETLGWTKKEMHYLYDVAASHKRRFPLPWWVLLFKPLIGEQRVMQRVRKYSAYLVFEKNKSW